MASQLTRAQVNKILEKFESPDDPPFVTVAACMCGISPDLAECAYENGRLGHGTPLENEFHNKVNVAQGAWAYKALRVINDPNLSKQDEARARQKLALLGKLMPVTFGGKSMARQKATPKDVKRTSAAPTKDELAQAISGLEEPEE